MVGDIIFSSSRIGRSGFYEQLITFVTAATVTRGVQELWDSTTAKDITSFLSALKGASFLGVLCRQPLKRAALTLCRLADESTHDPDAQKALASALLKLRKWGAEKILTELGLCCPGHLLRSHSPSTKPSQSTHFARICRIKF